MDSENKKKSKDKNKNIYDEDMLEEKIKNVLNKDISEIINI